VNLHLGAAAAVRTDPMIYRWYKIVNVYGATIKELIEHAPQLA
jgi:cyanate lyase